MEDRQKQVRRMLLIRVLLVPMAIVLLVCGTLVYHFANYSIQQVKGELARIAADHCTLIDQFFEERVTDLRFIASSYRLNELKNNGMLREIFHHLQAGSHAFFDIGVFDVKGKHLAYVGPYDLTGKEYGQTEWFQAVKENGLYISDEFLGYRNIPHFIVAVQRIEEEKTWYLRATIDTYVFNDLVEKIRIGKTGEAYLVNRDGILQSRRRSGGKLMEADDDFGGYIIEDESIASFSARSNNGQRYLYAVGPLRQTDWLMVVRQSATDAYETLTFAVIISVVMILVGGVVVLAMGFVQATNMANRLNQARMERQEMKTQLIIAGKLAEVGEMSMGLAHEINNPLQVMQSELAMIYEVMSEVQQADTPVDSENMNILKDSVDQIGVQIERCSKITHGLLKFARKRESTIQPIDMQTFLPEVVGMVEKRAHVENIRIIQEFNPDLPPIMSDANQLQQVFLNLLNNAVYALKGKESGRIRLKCFRDDEDMVVIVEDNGCGISPENMEKIYLPFFTTKPVGQGTGLGLSTAFGIVDGLGGTITVESEVNVGTVFTIRLPLSGIKKND